MKIKNIILAGAFSAVALLTIAAVRWSEYPFVISPGGSETLLVGDASTNHQWAISNMYTLTRSNANRGMQAGSDNLTNWSAIATSAKQDHSANLDLWNAVVPSSYQPILGYTPATTNFATTTIPGLAFPDGVTIVIDPTTKKWSSVATGTGDFVGPNGATSGNVVIFGSGTGKAGADSGHQLSEYTLLSRIASGSQSGVLSSSDWTTFNGKQAALGFTPLTSLQSFQQASNLILTLTLPIDALASNGVVTIFGVDQDTNPVPIHLRNNLSFSSDGVGGYNLDASGSGGTSVLGRTNLYARTTNAVVWDLLVNQTFNVGLLGTNSNLIISNAFALTNYENGQLGLHQWTNGGFTVATILVRNGLLRTNGVAGVTTNANATDLILARLDPTGTNVVLSWLTNCSSYTDTNSLLAGGGGGGGGTSATDNFTRANADPLSSPMSDGSSTWSSSVGSYPAATRIVVNRATGHSGFGSLSASKVSSPTFADDQTCSITIDANLSCGCGVRMQASSGAGYKIVPYSSTRIAMYRVDDSGSAVSDNLLPNYWDVSAMVSGDVLKISISGSTLSGYLNGVLLGTNTDATYSSGQPFIVASDLTTIQLFNATAP